jgi:hypothetical protein
MALEAKFLPPELTADRLRKTIEALLELESQVPAGDPHWSELRMVRRVLGRMLITAEELERAAALGVCGRA